MSGRVTVYLGLQRGPSLDDSRFTYAGQSIEIEEDHPDNLLLGQVYIKTDTRVLFDKVDLLTRQIETVTDSHRDTVDRPLAR